MSEFRKFNPKELELKDVHQLLLGSVAPRPIGFTASISKDGNLNLAPFSYHNAFSSNPPVVGISPAFSGRSGKSKNTLENILDTKEFTLSVVTHNMVEQMNICAAEFPHDINEFTKSGLTEHPSDIISVPGVQESPLIMECQFIQHIELSKEPAGGNLLLGEVVQFHTSEEVYNDKGQIDPTKMDQVARLGLNWYTRANQGLFELAAPKHIPIGVDALPEELINSPHFTSQYLARLASVEKIPKRENIIDIVSTCSSLSTEDMLKTCADLVNKGSIMEAWQVLYLAKII